jgi:hypothetical protein
MYLSHALAQAVRFVLTLALGEPALGLALDESVAAAAASPPTREPATPVLLFEATIAADHLPANPVWIDVYRMEWDTGATWPYSEPYRSARVWCVEAGQLVIEAEGSIAVARNGAGGAPATLPSGETTLGPGDCAVSPPEGPFAMRNPGPDQAVVASGMIVPANVDVPAGYPFGQVREEEPFGSSMYSFDLPPGPVTVRISRLALPPEVSYPEPGVDVPEAAAGVMQVVRVARSQEPAVAYLIAVAPGATEPATPAPETPAA